MHVHLHRQEADRRVYACVCTYTSRKLINAAAVTDHDITDDDGGAVQVRASYSMRCIALHTIQRTTCSMPGGTGCVHRTACYVRNTTLPSYHMQHAAYCTPRAAHTRSYTTAHVSHAAYFGHPTYCVPGGT